AGSGPPSRAATMIARASLEKSLQRLASAAPFLCLIELHLLSPDTRLLPDEVEEPVVDSSVVGQLGMERRDDEPPLAQEHRLAAWDHEHVEALELLGLADLDSKHAEAAQHREVLAEVALQGEDADRGPLGHGDQF